MDWKSIDGIRAFNRTYLAALNLYNQNYLDSGYTTTEARVMHEIYERKTCSANELLAVIPIDKGYMSRILKKFRQEGIIARTVSEEDRRVHLLAMTEYGLSVTEEMIKRSREDIRVSLANLSEKELSELSELLNRAGSIVNRSRKEELK